MKKLDVAVIIPALNPNEALIYYTKKLVSEGIAHVIVVNDGSKKDEIFNRLSKLEYCIVLHHDRNKGKGIALKTGFIHYLKHFHDLTGVVTADADGQHAVEDVIQIAQALETIRNALILGVRDLGAEHVPPKSQFGNKMTSFFFHHLYGLQLHDTQTGLRGIPTTELAWISTLKGERYEYEINMLIQAVRKKMKLIEMSIQTIYFENNSGSYYKAIRDSIKIFTKLIAAPFEKTSYYHAMENDTNGK